MAKNFRNIILAEKPASWWGSNWREGFFSGNGVIGANVYGGARHECILLNMAKLNWHGRTNVLPDVSLKMKEVKKASDDGDFMTVQEILPNALKAKNFRPNPADPLPMCCLNINTEIEKGIKEYSRTLDMESGEISVSFADGNAKHTRTLFVSRADNCIVLEMKKTGNKSIDAEFSFDLPKNFGGFDEELVMPDGVQSVYEKNFICFAARNDNGLDYGAVAKVSTAGGMQSVTAKSLKIKGASNIYIIIKLFSDSQKDREWKKLKDELTATKDGYDKLKKAHFPLHSKLYNSCRVDFGSDQDECPIENLLQRANHGEISSALIEKLWSFGRYLFISGANTANRMFLPTGIWNGDYKAVNGKIDNRQLTEGYRHIFKGNLIEMAEPFFKYFDEMAGSFKDNAQRLFGKRGVFVPAVCAPSTGRLGTLDPTVICDTSVAGVIADLYYRYYLYTQDDKFLKTRALPFMKNVALFYEEFFTTDVDGTLCTPFSCIPNYVPSLYRDDRPVVGANATLDFQVAKGVLSDLIEAGKIAGENQKDIDKWSEMLAKIPQEPVDNGEIKLYRENRCNNANAFGISMLYSAYPNDLVNRQSNAEDVKTYVNTAKEVYFGSAEEQNLANMANLAALFARFGDKNMAVECMRNVVKGGLAGNLSALDSDWRGMGYIANNENAAVQLYGNMAITNAIQEMLLGCCGNSLYILPCYIFQGEALSIEHLKAEGGKDVSMTYVPKSQMFTVTIVGKKNEEIEVVLPEGTKKMIKTNCGAVEQGGQKITGITLTDGKVCEISFKYIPAK